MMGSIPILRLIIDFILAILAAAIFEILNITENKFAIIIVFLLALIVLVFLDYYGTTTKKIKKCVVFNKNSNKIEPHDFRIAKFNEFYFKQKEYEMLVSSLKEKQNIFIIGKPKVGKTRAAYEALKLTKDFKIVKFKESYIDISEIPDRLFKGKIIIFFDDLNKYVGNLDFYELIEKLKDNSEVFILLATCRSGEEYEAAKEEYGEYFKVVIKLEDIGTDEAMQVTEKANLKYNSNEFDGSIGSLFLGNKAMKQRFDHLHEEMKVLFKMLKLLNNAGIFSPSSDILEILYLKELNRQKMRSSFMFESSLKILEDNSFIFIDNDGIYPVHDTYLDFIDFEADTSDLKWLEQILIKNKNVNELYRLGVTFSNKNMFEDAISCFNSVLTIKPTFAEAWNDKGVVFGKLEKNNKALECYKEALKIYPNYAMTWLNKGSSLANLDNIEEALQCFNRSVELAPDLAEAWYHKGRAMGTLAENNEERYEAIKSFDKALDIKPLFPEPYFEKGMLMGVIGEAEEGEEALKCSNKALKCFDKALKINPNLGKVWLSKGLFLEFQGNYEGAQQCLDEALKIDPDLNFFNDINLR